MGRMDFRGEGSTSTKFWICVSFKSFISPEHIFIKYLLYARYCAGLWAHGVIKSRFIAFTTLDCNCVINILK